MVKNFSVGGWAGSSGSNTEKAGKEAADYQNSMALLCGSKTKVIFLQLKKILEMSWSLTTKWKSVLIWLEPNVIKNWTQWHFGTGLIFSSLFPFSKTEYRMSKEEGRDKSHKILFWIVSNRCSHIKHKYFNYTFYSWTMQHTLCVDETKCSCPLGHGQHCCQELETLVIFALGQTNKAGAQHNQDASPK